MAAKRILVHAYPSQTPVRQILVLLQNDGSLVRRLDSAAGSYRRIHQDGVWFTHRGVDQATGEHVYTPETEAA